MKYNGLYVKFAMISIKKQEVLIKIISYGHVYSTEGNIVDSVQLFTVQSPWIHCMNHSGIVVACRASRGLDSIGLLSHMI